MICSQSVSTVMQTVWIISVSQNLCVYLFALENENSEVNSHWNTLHLLLGEFIKTIISTIVAVFPCPCILTAKKQKE